MLDPDLQAHFDDETGVLSVAGELDGAAVAQLAPSLARHSLDFTRALVVDLSEVAYLPSHAVGVLARAAKRAEAAGVALVLVAATGSVAQRVLAVCGMPHTAR